MTSSTNNIEYDVNGIQSGECGIIFSSTITDMVSPLQTGGQSQNLNSMTGSLERGNKGANCEGEKELSAKIKILQTKYKKLLKHDAVESQKIVYLRDINRTYEYLQLVEGKVSWSKVEETVDADQAAYEEECQDDWAIHDDLYDEEQEIFEQLQYHFEGFECPVEIVNARKARDAAHQALLDDVNQCLVSAPSKPNNPKTFRDSKPKTPQICIKCDSPAVVHSFCADWCDECWNAANGEQPTTVRLSSGSIVHMASMPVTKKPKIKIIKAEERQRRAELERMDKEIKRMNEENKKLREMIEENKKYREMIDDEMVEENQIMRGMIVEDMKLLWFTVCTPAEWHTDGMFHNKSVEIMEKWISFADLQNLKKQRDGYISGHAEVPILQDVVFE